MITITLRLLLHSSSLSCVFGRCCFSLTSSLSRRVTPLPASQRQALLVLDLKFESSRAPGNTGPSLPPPVAHRSTVPTKPRVCVGRPQPATVIVHTEHAEGGSIASCYLRARGQGDMLHDLLKGAVLLAWEIRSAVQFYHASLFYDYPRTGIIFFFENFYSDFFLSRKCCAPPSDRER